MMINKEAYTEIQAILAPKNVALIAVSKTKPAAAIMELYDMGHRDFGENYVQELVDKQATLPKDIRWHFIGHLQTNKVKYIAPFVHLIHGVDTLKLLAEINKQAAKNERIVNCLLQMHIAGEETKFGMNDPELNQAVGEVNNQPGHFTQVAIKGLMGMASFSEDQVLVRNEFRQLKLYYDRYAKSIPSMPWDILSMGMSGDYPIAIEEGSTMVRIGSLLFGERDYQQ